MSNSKVVLVTGASSGLGAATAKLLAQRGFQVFGTSRNPQKVQIDGVIALPLDVRSTESVQTCVQEIVHQLGRLDVLINNAGYVGPASASEEMALPQLKALFDTNFFGTVQMTNTVLPLMREQQSGCIINISSLGGRVAFPFFSAYIASKHALEGYSESLRYEVRDFGIHVCLVEPGFFKTNIATTTEAPANPVDAYAEWRRLMGVRDKYSIEHGRDPLLVAQKILDIIQDPAPALRYPVGLDAQVMTRAKRFLPTSLFERLMRLLTLEGDVQSDGKSSKAWGWRRYLVDSKIADALVPLLLGSLIAVALLGGVSFLRKSRRKR